MPLSLIEAELPLKVALFECCLLTKALNNYPGGFFCYFCLSIKFLRYHLPFSHHWAVPLLNLHPMRDPSSWDKVMALIATFFRNMKPSHQFGYSKYFLSETISATLKRRVGCKTQFAWKSFFIGKDSLLCFICQPLAATLNNLRMRIYRETNLRLFNTVESFAQLL